MWNFLKQDLAELVSTMQEDTHLVLERVEASQLTKRQTAALKEAERRMSLEETYLVPLLYSEEISDKEAVEKEDGDGEKSLASSVSADSNNGSKDTSDKLRISEERDQEKRTILSDQDAEEVQQIEAFLSEFQLEAKTSEISDLLEQHPETLQAYFEDLVPAVLSYADFWQRYFYRCDPVRIEAEWQLEEDRARLARQELVGKVSNLLGGAAKAVAFGVANALTEDDQRLLGQASKNNAPRPPFVLNTAVDEDEDDEEELGWDDDDDDDKEEYLSTGLASGITSSNASVGDENNVTEEQIEFKDEQLELAKEQLKQALEERDQLHQTVEMQKKELIHLKEVAASGGGKVAIPDELETLHMQLQEKEAELLAVTLKSSNPGEQTDSLSAQLQKLTSMLSEKEVALLQLQSSTEASQKEWQSQMSTLEQASAAFAEADSKRKLELTDLRKQLFTLEAELQTCRSQLATAESNVLTLQNDLEATKEALRTASEAGQSGETPSTVSTGDNLQPPETAAVASKMISSDEDDGWGDEW